MKSYNKLVKLIAPFKENVSTITYDNGKELPSCQIAEALEANGYLAHPYNSWERGLNENTYGLIRQYFPKKPDFSNIMDNEIEEVMNALNNCPECLVWKLLIRYP